MLQVFHLEPNIFLHLNVKSRVIRLQDSPQKPIDSTKHLKSDVSAAAAAMAHFLIGSFIFLEWGCRSCLYILEISCLSVKNQESFRGNT